jgi:hypothetical protein
VRVAGLHEGERGERAAAEPLLEVGVAHRQQRAVLPRVGVVDQDVDPAEPSGDLLDEAGDGLQVADVAAERLGLAAAPGDQLARRVQLGRGPAEDGDGRALRCERQGDALADALTGAGHDRDLFVEACHASPGEVKVRERGVPAEAMVM